MVANYNFIYSRSVVKIVNNNKFDHVHSAVKASVPGASNRLIE